jgi:hypothetical protein
MAVPRDFYNSLFAISLFALVIRDFSFPSRNQFTILSFVRLNSWSIAKYSSISGLARDQKGGGCAALLSPHCLLTRHALDGGVFTTFGSACWHIGCKPGGTIASHGRTLTRKIKINAVRTRIVGSRAGDATRNGR